MSNSKSPEFCENLYDYPPARMIALAVGFAAILGLDYAFRNLAPLWWLRLRVILTAVVLASLGTTIVFM